MSNSTVFIFNKTPFLSIIHHYSLLLFFQENAFLNNRIEILVSNRSKCVFLQNRNTTSNFVDTNKTGNQGLYKANCWCQQVNFSGESFILLTDINVGQLGNFLFHSKQKNRKPEPAVKEQFRKFPFYLFNCNQAFRLYCELWLICHAAVWFEVVPAFLVRWLDKSIRYHSAFFSV